MSAYRKFGEIDSNQILENEYRIAVLEKVVDLLIEANPDAATNRSPLPMHRAVELPSMSNSHCPQRSMTIRYNNPAGII